MVPPYTVRNSVRLLSRCMSDDQDWQRRYCFLALRLNRLLHGSALLYYGPAEWQSQVAAEEPTAAELLIDEADELLADADSPHLVAHLDAMKAVARFTTGQPMPFGDLVDAIVGLPAGVDSRDHLRTRPRTARPSAAAPARVPGGALPGVAAALLGHRSSVDGTSRPQDRSRVPSAYSPNPRHRARRRRRLSGRA